MYRLLFISIFLLCSHNVFSQWEATLKSIYDGSYNTLLFLNHQPLDTFTREFKIEISFRYPMNHRVVHTKEFYITTYLPRLYTYKFDLPQHEYEVDIDIVDLENQAATNIPITYQCRYQPDRLSISDIFLAYRSADNFINLSPLLQPIPTLDTSQNTINFYLEIYAPGYTQIPAEAILYTNQAHDQPQSIKFISLQKKDEILNVEAGRAIFTGSFDLRTLELGNYRILINVTGEESVNNSTNFILKGNTKARIFADVDNSIQMMGYIIPEESIENLQRIADPNRRRDSLLQIWNKLFPSSPEQPFATEEAMESYYGKIFTFLDNFAYEGEDWSSARAKIYLMYGEPDSGWENIQTIEYNGKMCERWTYFRYNMAFTFERRNNQYILVE